MHGFWAMGSPPLGAEPHRETEVKAVTYHGLRIERRDDAWTVRLVVDV